MPLSFTYACVTKTSYVGLALNLLLTIYVGIQMPDGILSRWMSCQCVWKGSLKRPPNQPPFFFKEVRLGMLVVSILFNIGRLIYEASMGDVSVILVGARLFGTSLQLIDHWWFCKHWESFFLQMKRRGYIWLRLFISVMLFGTLYCVQITFPPYREGILIIDAFQWTAGLQSMIWYFWGKQVTTLFLPLSHNHIFHLTHPRVPSNNPCNTSPLSLSLPFSNSFDSGEIYKKKDV